MTLTLVPPERIPHEWDAILPVLKPAIERGKQDMWRVLGSLVSGERALFRVSGACDGYLAAFADYPKGANVKTLWIWLAAGRVSGGPRTRVRHMRAVLNEIEDIARSVNCKRVRIEGRAEWWRILNDYSEISRDGDKVIFERGVR